MLRSTFSGVMTRQAIQSYRASPAALRAADSHVERGGLAAFNSWLDELEAGIAECEAVAPGQWGIKVEAGEVIEAVPLDNCGQGYGEEGVR